MIKRTLTWNSIKSKQYQDCNRKNFKQTAYIAHNLTKSKGSISSMLLWKKYLCTCMLCELRYIGVISGFLPIQIIVMLPGPRKYLVITKTLLYGVCHILVPLYLKILSVYSELLNKITWGWIQDLEMKGWSSRVCTWGQKWISTENILT